MEKFAFLASRSFVMPFSTMNRPSGVTAGNGRRMLGLVVIAEVEQFARLHLPPEETGGGSGKPYDHRALWIDVSDLDPPHAVGCDSRLRRELFVRDPVRRHECLKPCFHHRPPRSKRSPMATRLCVRREHARRTELIVTAVGCASPLRSRKRCCREIFASIATCLGFKPRVRMNHSSRVASRISATRIACRSEEHTSELQSRL